MDATLFRSVLDYFAQQSGLANAIQIVTVLVLLGSAGYKIWLHGRRRGPVELEAWLQAEPRFNSKRFGEIPSNLNIAVVDDKPEDVPVDHLRRLGHRVTIFESIPLAEYRRLLEFDLIFLDIAGVVPEDPKTGGIELLNRVQAHDVHPIVIAISGKKYLPSGNAFFRAADKTLDKRLSATECEAAITELYRERRSPIHAARRLDYRIAARHLSDKKKRQANLAVVEFANGELDMTGLEPRLSDTLSRNEIDPAVRDAQIIKVALSSK